MTIGWIKLYRLLLDNIIFQNAHALQVFLYCLLKAAYKEMKINVGNQVIVLQPGQLLYGRKSVSQKLNMGEGKLRGIMEYLVNNGSIEIESHSRYSIVTIVNWEQYQRGDSEPAFPFDIDFFDEDDTPMDEVEKSEKIEVMENVVESVENNVERKAERKFDPFAISYDGYKDWREESYGVSFEEADRNFRADYKNVRSMVQTNGLPDVQPAKNQASAQSEIAFGDLTTENATSREPQYNKIKKYKNNKIKNNKTRENKRKEDRQNTKDTQTISHYRQSGSVVNDIGEVEKVAGLNVSHNKYPSGSEVSNGEGMSVSMVDIADAAFSSEAFDALSNLDDAALDAYFASCSFADFDNDDYMSDAMSDIGMVELDDSFEPIPLDESDMPVEYRRSGHDFIAEMTYTLTQQDIEQLDAMFTQQSVAAIGYPPFAQNETVHQPASQTIKAAVPYQPELFHGKARTEICKLSVQ